MRETISKKSGVAFEFIIPKVANELVDCLRRYTYFISV